MYCSCNFIIVLNKVNIISDADFKMMYSDYRQTACLACLGAGITDKT